MLLEFAKSILEQLRSPAVKEILLARSSKKDFKRVEETIESITCFIYDAEQRQSNEPLVRLWLSRLREILYEVDDLFDAIAAMALHKKAIDGRAFDEKVTFWLSRSNRPGFNIKIAHSIKGIRKCLDVIKDDISKYNLQHQIVEEKRPNSLLEPEERYSFVDTSKVIGRDREKEDIISLLLSENSKEQNLEVISVIGIRGVGKTTLAQLVYNDERVQTGFDVCIWTCINYFSDLDSVLIKILTSILKYKPKNLRLDHLQTELSEKIQGKKYLLVLDDVWDTNAYNWNQLETLLSVGKTGSKVLITTGKVKVAQCLEAFKPFYKLDILSEESAWYLFVRIVFNDGEFVGDFELDSLGKQIIRKCGYVPLLVALVGSVLRLRKKEKEVWLSFLENEFAEVAAGNLDDENMMKVLKVSYDDLPPALKRCFAYCSIFPKDYDIEKEELIHMWMAQGFIKPCHGRSLEETADDYFSYLVDKCFFQEVKKDESDFGVVKYTCKMNSFLRDMAIQVAETMSTYIHDRDCRDMVEKSSTLYHM